MNKQELRFSFVIPVYDQAPELRDNLPAILTQDYEPGHEVVVIDETSSDETPDVLKLLKQEHPNLYTTFLPKPNRQVTRRKLAISIGVKAAKNEWIIITGVHNKPKAPDILQAIADNLDSSQDVTLGYLTRKGICLQPFATCDDVRQHIRKAERRLTKIRNRKHMGYAWGRYDFIIIRKDQVYDLLKFYEEKIPCGRLFFIRMSIFMKNLFGRSANTQLITE